MGKRTKHANVRSTAESKRERFLYRIFWAFVFVFLAYYWFWEPIIIGPDRWVWYFNFWPMCAGALLLLYFSFGWLKKIAFADEKIGMKVFWFVLMIPGGLVFLYLFIGFPGKAIFDQLCLNAAKEKPQETISTPVLTFHQKRGSKSTNRIYFEFQGERESLAVDRETMAEFKNENPYDYTLEITVREGILGAYILETWNVVHK